MTRPGVSDIVMFVEYKKAKTVKRMLLPKQFYQLCGQKIRETQKQPLFSNIKSLIFTKSLYSSPLVTFSFAIIMVLLPQVSSHSWVERIDVLSPDGVSIGKSGYPRGNGVFSLYHYTYM